MAETKGVSAITYIAQLYQQYLAFKPCGSGYKLGTFVS